MKTSSIWLGDVFVGWDGWVGAGRKSNELCASVFGVAPLNRPSYWEKRLSKSPHFHTSFERDCAGEIYIILH